MYKFRGPMSIRHRSSARLLARSAGLFLALLAPVSSQEGRSPSPPEDPVVVTVNGSAIRQSEVVARLWKLYGPATVQDLVDEQLLGQAAAELKLKADAKEIDKRLQALKREFRDEEAFLARLKRVGSSIDEVKRQLGEQIVREELVLRRKGIAVGEAEIKGYFDKNKASLAAPEQARLRYILLRTEQEARDALLALRAGADFAKLAAAKSLDPSKDKGGDLGFISRGKLQPEIENLAFSLKPGEADLIGASGGWHLLQMVETKASLAADFKKVKDDVRQTLLSTKIAEAFPSFLQELREKAKIEPRMTGLR
ncbi:MAG: peptidyl-prolyl cis-trans isomerase [Elusimicrobiota bacterium]